MRLAGLKHADANHLARDFFATRIADGNDDAVFARPMREGNRDGSLNAQSGNSHWLWLGDPGVEAQVMPARRAYICADQHRRLAVRTGS